MSEPITIFSDYGCPSAQRIETVLTQLDVPHARRTVDGCDKPLDLLSLSPTGRIPLVTVGDLVLYDSSVVADYFAERFDWREAYPHDAEGRAFHCLAIRRLDAMWDSFAVEQEAGALPPRRVARIEEDLDALERIITRYPAREPCILVFTAVPFWLRWEWVGAGTEMGARIRARAVLFDWLSAGARLPALLATTPDAERTRRTHSCAG